jgi:gluconolactonase
MFFAPPEVLQTTVFARLSPVASVASVGKAADGDNHWAARQPFGTPSKSLLEGPSFDRDGQLYCVDLPNGRIVRYAKDGTETVVVEYDGWPNGLKFHRDGRIFIADYKHGIMVLDPQTRKLAPFLERFNVERFKALNDLFFAANGDLYFTDQGLSGHQDPTGRLFRLSAAGKLECLLSNVPSPNGLVMNLDETAVYLAVTRANAVWRVPLMRDGSVAKVGTFVQLSGGIGPDGLALDSAGRLAIAHTGLGCVWIVDANGEPVYRVNSCEGLHTTNVAYGGANGRTLYITESWSGSVLAAELDIPGKAMFSAAADGC